MTQPSAREGERHRIADAFHGMARFNDRFMYALPGGAGRTTPRVAINLHKLGVGPLVLVLMLSTQNFSLAAWLYLVVHGSYGVLWVLKDVCFGDAAWRRPCSVASAVALFCVLALYFVAPLTLLTPLGEILPGRIAPPEQLTVATAASAVACFVIGVFFHFVSDCHEHFALKYQQPKRLITDGLFALSRNPNYFGELLIYASFNLLAQHWAPWVACTILWVQVFLTNMLRKDRSMARHPEHAAWARCTPFLVPSPIAILHVSWRGLRSRG